MQLFQDDVEKTRLCFQSVDDEHTSPRKHYRIVDDESFNDGKKTVKKKKEEKAHSATSRHHSDSNERRIMDRILVNNNLLSVYRKEWILLIALVFTSTFISIVCGQPYANSI